MNKKLLSIKLLLVFALFASNVFAQATFTPKTDFALTTGSGAMYLTSADLNNDGKPDLITGNQNLNGISILFNTTVTNASTPTFSTPVDFPTGNACHSVAAGDINGDGLIDLVAVNTTSSTASVYLNLTTPGAAAPTLSAKTDFSTGANPYSVKLSDINGDGKLDIVCANQVANTFGVFLNTTTTGASTPTFSAMTPFTTAAGPTHLAVGDLNGDGKPDVVVPNNTAGTISVFFNTTTTGASTPTFTLKTDYTAGTTAWCVSIGDINLDGKPDIACANRGSASVSVFLNETATGAASPSFGAATTLTVPSTPFFVNVADINNDGLPDILAGSRGASSFSVYLNTTTPGAVTPTFAAISSFTTGSQPYLPVVADYNGDGKQDVAIPNGTAGVTVSVFLNTTGMGASSPSLSANTNFTIGNNPYSVAVADLNGDGKPDEAAANLNSNNVSVLLNTTTPGASTPTFSPKTDFTTGTAPHSVYIKDLNGDGKPDLAVANSGSTSVSVFLNTTTPGASTPTFSAKTDFTTGTSPYGVSIGDFNGDGLPDLAVANFASTFVSVFLNTTAPGASTPTFSAKTDFTTGAGSNSVSIGDFNGDGKSDLAILNRNSNTVSVLLNTTTPGASTPTFSARTDFATGSNPNIVSIGDLNGDGKPDMEVANENSNSVSVFLNTTSPGALTPTFSANTDFTTGSTPGSVSIGDLNGDGKPDLVSANLGSGTISVLLNTTTPGASTPTFAAKTDFTTGSFPNIVAIADVNGDGKPDVSTVNIGISLLSVLLNTAVLPLPVELASFTSRVNGNNVLLNWNTVQEENNSGFDIERSSFGAGWNKVAFVNGAGTVSTPRNYSFTDNGLNPGRYNYRLKQIDYNGNFTYYDLSGEVIIGVPTKFALSQNYPNPFNPVTKINYSIPSSNFVTLKIFDISGREMMQLVNEKQEAGYYTVNFNASAFSSGTYFYKLSSDNFSEVKKMMVIK